MGSEESHPQTCKHTNATPFSNQKLKERLSNTSEPPELQEQLCDNPSRGLLSGSFLRTAVTASHSLLELTPKAAPFSKPTPQAVSLNKADEEGSVQNTSSGEADDRPFERPKMINSTKRVSIECLMSTDQNLKSDELIQPISDYILSEQNHFSPTVIAKESFVRFRNEDVSRYYSIEERLGEGGFGVVYRAVCRQTGAVKAAKILKKSRMPKQQLKKVENEVDFLKKLDHPNILKAYEAYLYAGNYCIITELCQGGSLYSNLREGRHFSERAIGLIFRKLMSALAYLHQLGIAHRDIKLDNILLVRKESGSGSSWDIRLIDFGLAKKLSAPRVRDREKVGTHTYMAPEVIRGLYSTKCDIWSAGIALCCMATDSNPFKKKTKQHTYESIMNNSFNTQGPMWRNVSADLKNLLTRMLTKDVGQRISAAGALAHPFLRVSREFQAEQDREAIDQVIKKISAYYQGNNLVSLIQSYLSYTTLTAKEIQQLASLFQTIDLNSDGFIQRQQLQSVFSKFGSPLAEAQLQYILGKLDKNKSGRIDFSQFVTALTDRSKLFTQSALVSAFRYFDANNSGFLEKDELQSALKLVQGRQLEFLLAQIDKNNDDKISQQQFLNYLTSQPQTRQS